MVLLVEENLNIGKHAGLKLIALVFDLGSQSYRPGFRVENVADEGDLAFEYGSRVCRHSCPGLLADPDLGDVLFINFSIYPKQRRIHDCQYFSGFINLASENGIIFDDFPADRGKKRNDGIDLVCGSDDFNLFL